MGKVTNLLPWAGAAGVASILIMSASFWWGLGIFLATVTVLGVVIKSRSTEPKPPVQIQTVAQAFDPYGVERLLPAQPVITPRPADTKSTAGQFLSAMRVSGNKDLLSAVLVEGGESPIYVRDAVIALAEIAEEQKIPASELAAQMPQIVDKMWDRLEQGCNQHPNDRSALARFIALNAMTDARKASAHEH